MLTGDRFSALPELRRRVPRRPHTAVCRSEWYPGDYVRAWQPRSRSTASTRRRAVSWRNRCGWTWATSARRPRIANGTIRSLWPLPFLIEACPERGCSLRSDHVKLTSSSTRRPVFNRVVTMASTMDPARSASRRSRWRSSGLNPWGASGWLAIGLSLAVGFVLTRPVPSPAIETLDRRQRGIHRCRLLAVGELSAVLAHIMAGRVDEVGTVLLPQ